MDDVRKWFHFPIEMPVTAAGEGPATVGLDAAKITYEVWDVELNTHASFDNLPDAINEAMRLNAALTPATNGRTICPDPYFTGVYDANGEAVYEGDRVLYKLEGKHTKREYWNPEYEVVRDPPCFTLRHVGGGLPGDNYLFKLKYGGSNGDLFIIDRSNRKVSAALTPASDGRAEGLREAAEVAKGLAKKWRNLPESATLAPVYEASALRVADAILARAAEREGGNQ